MITILLEAYEELKITRRNSRISKFQFSVRTKELIKCISATAQPDITIRLLVLHTARFSCGLSGKIFKIIKELHLA